MKDRLLRLAPWLRRPGVGAVRLVFFVAAAVALARQDEAGRLVKPPGTLGAGEHMQRQVAPPLAC